MYKAFLALFSGGLIGKVLGIVRELLMASLFGTGPLIASYRVAQTSILVPINFFTADVLTAAVIPLTKRYLDEGQAVYRASVAVLHYGFLLLALLLTLLIYRYAGWVVTGLAPGLTPEVQLLATRFAETLSLVIPAYVLGNLFAYLEMAQGGYTLASIRASIQSLGLIAGTVVAVYGNAPVALAWGFTGAYYVYAAYGVVLLRRKTMLGSIAVPELAICRRVFGEVWVIIRPLLFLPFLMQGNVAVERVIASLLGGPVVAAVDYARFITETGIILLAVPMGLAGLSTLSGMNRFEFSLQLSRVLPLLFMIAVPISAFLWLHSELIVHLLYQRGAFDAESSRLTQVIVQGLALGFWAQVVGYVLIKALNAQLRSADVLRLSVLSIAANLAVNVLFFALCGPLVLGLSVSVGAVVQLLYASKLLELSDSVYHLLGWLVLGVVGYLLLAGYTAMPGWWGLLLDSSVAVVYWLSYIRLVPALYAKTAPLFEHRPWRLA